MTQFNYYSYFELDSKLALPYGTVYIATYGSFNF